MNLSAHFVTTIQQKNSYSNKTHYVLLLEMEFITEFDRI